MDSSSFDINTSDIEIIERNRPPSAASSRSCLSSLSNHSGPEYLAQTIAEMHPNRPPITAEDRLAARTRRLNMSPDEEDTITSAPDPSWIPYEPPSQAEESTPLLQYRISPREDVSWEVLERFTERLRYETGPNGVEMWDLPGLETIDYWDVRLTTAQVELYREDPAVEGIYELAPAIDGEDYIEEDVCEEMMKTLGMIWTVITESLGTGEWTTRKKSTGV